MRGTTKYSASPTHLTSSQKLDEKTMQKPVQQTAEDDGKMVKVTGQSLKSDDEELCKYYFENTKRNGGGETSCVMWDDKRKCFFITFLESAVAERVISREQSLNNCQIQVELCQPPPLPRDRGIQPSSTSERYSLLPTTACQKITVTPTAACQKITATPTAACHKDAIKPTDACHEDTVRPIDACHKDRFTIFGVPESTTNDCLRNYLEVATDVFIESLSMEGDHWLAVLDSSNEEIDVQKMNRHCRETPLVPDIKLTIKGIPKQNTESTIFVSGLNQITVDDTISLFFSNKRRNNGGPVKKVQRLPDKSKALVHFEKHEDAESVVKRGEFTLDNYQLFVALYLGTDIEERQETTKSASLRENMHTGPASPKREVERELGTETCNRILQSFELLNTLKVKLKSVDARPQFKIDHVIISCLLEVPTRNWEKDVHETIDRFLRILPPVTLPERIPSRQEHTYPKSVHPKREVERILGVETCNRILQSFDLLSTLMMDLKSVGAKPQLKTGHIIVSCLQEVPTRDWEKGVHETIDRFLRRLPPVTLPERIPSVQEHPYPKPAPPKKEVERELGTETCNRILQSFELLNTLKVELKSVGARPQVKTDHIIISCLQEVPTRDWEKSIHETIDRFLKKLPPKTPPERIPPRQEHPYPKPVRPKREVERKLGAEICKRILQSFELLNTLMMDLKSVDAKLQLKTDHIIVSCLQKVPIRDWEKGVHETIDRFLKRLPPVTPPERIAWVKEHPYPKPGPPKREVERKLGAETCKRILQSFELLNTLKVELKSVGARPQVKTDHIIISCLQEVPTRDWEKSIHETIDRFLKKLPPKTPPERIPPRQEHPYPKPVHPKREVERKLGAEICKRILQSFELLNTLMMDLKSVDAKPQLKTDHIIVSCLQKVPIREWEKGVHETIDRFLKRLPPVTPPERIPWVKEHPYPKPVPPKREVERKLGAETCKRILQSFELLNTLMMDLKSVDAKPQLKTDHIIVSCLQEVPTRNWEKDVHETIDRFLRRLPPVTPPELIPSVQEHPYPKPVCPKREVERILGVETCNRILQSFVLLNTLMMDLKSVNAEPQLKTDHIIVSCLQEVPERDWEKDVHETIDRLLRRLP